MPRGGKREGAGRKAQGITRKVSLTLTEEQWNRIDKSGEPTVAAYIQSLMNKETLIIEAADIHSELGDFNHKEYRGLNRKEAEEYWTIFANFEESAAPDIMEGAKAVFLRVLFPKGAESAKVEVKPNFICPFTGKRFGSMKALIKAAVPHLIQAVSKEERH